LREVAKDALGFFGARIEDGESRGEIVGQKVAILGASAKPERYSNKAFHLLREYGHTAIPVAPALKELEGVKVVPTLSEIKEPIDTLTMYVGPQISDKLHDSILKLKPRRVIFNPGSENPALKEKLEGAGIKVEEACTLVLLRTNQF
jgi:predicted CoA-binding protein